MKGLNMDSAKRILYVSHAEVLGEDGQVGMRSDGDIYFEYCDGSTYVVRDRVFATFKKFDLLRCDAEEIASSSLERVLQELRKIRLILQDGVKISKEKS